jgi:crotonobetainyl-CoA:carnitine CoA-transferase CaiB-like acyl-CoA transferase
MTDARRADFLAGIRVLELGDGVAGAAATGILWSLGAEVTTVVDASSAHRRARPAVMRDGTPASLLSIILDRGKQLLPLADLAQIEALVSRVDDEPSFDLVVFDRVPGATGPLASLHPIENYTPFVERNNGRAWLTISAFGLTGERAGDIATELTVAAASGMLAVARDERTGRPLKLAGQQSLLNTGHAGALAACHAIDLAADAPVHLDLAAVEATLAMGPVLEVGGHLLDTGSLGGAKRYGAPADFYKCKDGHIRISAMEDHQWRGVVAAMGSPAWAGHFAAVQTRIDAADEIDERVAAWTRDQTKREVETMLQSHGVPATAVYTPEEILQSPQLTHRNVFEPLRLESGEAATIVGAPFRVVGGASDDDGGARRRRRALRGLRVLEASRVLAVPLAGAILGALGADVTKVEDLPRLDMYRRRGPYIDGTPGVERGAYFALMNHSKRSAAFDVDAHRDRLADQLRSTDVVLENLGPKRATALGLAASNALESNPDVLAVSFSGFGQDGPHAEYRAYAYNLQASCGLGYLTRSEAGESGEIDIAWADLISAYALATIVAAWAVGPEGNAGVGLDFAMADLVVARFNEFLAAVSIGIADDDLDRANEVSPYAPSGVYSTADGWIALAVDTDEQFARLVSVLAYEPVDDPTVADGEARFEQRKVLDERVSAATRSRSSRDLVTELSAAGIPVEEVVQAADLLKTDQLCSRGFFTEVEHPEWGRRGLVGIPWRVHGGPPIQLGAPPLLTPSED